jgi:hypothetical protein
MNAAAFMIAPSRARSGSRSSSAGSKYQQQTVATKERAREQQQCTRKTICANDETNAPNKPQKQPTNDHKIRTRTTPTWGAVTSSTQADGRGYSQHARQYDSAQPQQQNGQEPQRQPRRWLHPAAFGPYAPYPRRSRRRSCRLPRGDNTAHTTVPSHKGYNRARQ